MKLFDKFYNGNLQFLLELLALNRPFTIQEAMQLGEQSHIDAPYGMESAVSEWIKKDKKRKERDEDPLKPIEEMSDSNLYRLRLKSFALPLSNLEKEYLFDLCNSDEANLILPDDFRKKISVPENNFFSNVYRHYSNGRRNESSRYDPGVVQMIIKGIHEKRWIHYQFSTRSNAAKSQSQSVPYRIEVSAFDGRWWLIAYLPEQRKTIKARIENISDVTLGEKHTVKEDMIKQAILDRIAPEPVELRIKGKGRKLKNSVERCFITFENMLDMEAYQLSDTEYRLQFRYFQWDELLIIRKLLWLGEDVTAVKPPCIVQGVLDEIKMALASYD